MIEYWTYVFQSAAWSIAGFVVGRFSVRLKREVDEIKEAAVSDETASDLPKRRTSTDHPLSVPRWVGVVVIVLSLFTVGQAWYFARQNRETSDCQVATIKEFQKALTTRTDVATEDRRVIDKLVLDVTQATTREQSRAALEAYVAARKANDIERAKSPLPEIKDCKERG